MANIYFSNSLISVIKWTIGFAKKSTERYEKGRIFELLPVRGNVSLFPSLVYYDYVFCEALNALSPSPPSHSLSSCSGKNISDKLSLSRFPGPEWCECFIWAMTRWDFVHGKDVPWDCHKLQLNQPLICLFKNYLVFQYSL